MAKDWSGLFTSSISHDAHEFIDPRDREPCPVCGRYMKAQELPTNEALDGYCYYLKCTCGLTYRHATKNMTLDFYEDLEKTWDLWDSGISEQRKKWLKKPQTPEASLDSSTLLELVNKPSVVDEMTESIKKRAEEVFGKGAPLSIENVKISGGYPEPCKVSFEVSAGRNGSCIVCGAELTEGYGPACGECDK